MSRAIEGAWWEDFDCLDEKGATMNVVLKLSTYVENLERPTGPRVFWELRRILPCMYANPRGIHQIIKEHLSQFRESCRMVGMRWQDELHPSKFAKLFAEDGYQKAHEYEASTRLLLVVLLSGLNGYQKVSLRSKSLLSTFLVSTLGPDDCQEFVVKEVPADLCADNVHNPLFDPSAHCGLEQGIALNFYSLDPPQKKLCGQLTHIYLYHKKSDVALEWLERILIQIAGRIDTLENWEDNWKSDYLEHGGCLVLHAKGKRRRMDVGLQSALGSAIVSTGRAGTTGQFLRSHPTLYHANSCTYLNDKAVTVQVAAGWLSFHGTEHLSLIADGVRSGKPATEDLVAAAYRCEKDVSTWLPLVDR